VDKKFRITLSEKAMDTFQTTSDTAKKALDFILHQVMTNMRAGKLKS